MGIRLCSYGCGNPAVKFSSRTGKWCCAEHPRQCPAYKKQVAERTRKQMHEVYGSEEERKQRKQAFFSYVPIETECLCVFGCGQTAHFYRAATKSFCCAKNGKYCPASQKRAAEKAIAAADRKTGKTPEERKQTLLQKKTVRDRERVAKKKAEVPPEGQLCEYGCGQPARFRLRDHHAHYHWCCSKQYKQCPSACLKSEEARKETCLEKYGVEHHFQDPKFIEMREQTSLERYGVPNAISLPEFKEKKKQTELARHGSLRSGYEKRLQLFRALYGIDHWNQLPGMGQRVQATIRARFGCHYFENEEWRQKQKEKTGYEHPALDPKVIAQRKSTCLERYGVESSGGVEEVKAKARATCLERYGATNVMHSPVFFHKQLVMGYTRKPFTFPSGRVIQVQGYEPLVLQELLDSGITESDICVGYDCPSFFYEFEGKRHRYYPDIYIPSQDKFIEVKSSYTFKKNLFMNLAKAKAVIDAGHVFEFHIKAPTSLSSTRIVPELSDPFVESLKCST